MKTRGTVTGAVRRWWRSETPRPEVAVSAVLDRRQVRGERMSARNYPVCVDAAPVLAAMTGEQRREVMRSQWAWSVAAKAAREPWEAAVVDAGLDSPREQRRQRSGFPGARWVERDDDRRILVTIAALAGLRWMSENFYGDVVVNAVEKRRHDELMRVAGRFAPAGALVHEDRLLANPRYAHALHLAKVDAVRVRDAVTAAMPVLDSQGTRAEGLGGFCEVSAGEQQVQREAETFTAAVVFASAWPSGRGDADLVRGAGYCLAGMSEVEALAAERERQRAWAAVDLVSVAAADAGVRALVALRSGTLV